MWESVRIELRVLAQLTFLVEVNLAAPPAPLAFCADASTNGYALHVSDIAPDELDRACAVRERWRFTVAEKLLAPEEARTPARDWVAAARSDPRAVVELGLVDGPGLEPGRQVREGRGFANHEDHHLVTPLEDSLVSRERWRLVVARPWQHHEPIHVKEARVALLAVRRACRMRHMLGRRLLVLGDNLAEICAVERGRSSRDGSLRAVLLHLAALVIGSGIRLNRRYIETHRNPSDEDSRRWDRKRVGHEVGSLGLRPPRRPPEALGQGRADLCAGGQQPSHSAPPRACAERLEPLRDATS